MLLYAASEELFRDAAGSSRQPWQIFRLNPPLRITQLSRRDIAQGRGGAGVHVIEPEPGYRWRRAHAALLCGLLRLCSMRHRAGLGWAAELRTERLMSLDDELIDTPDGPMT